MACVNEKGQLSESAKAVLKAAMEQAKSPMELAGEVGLPLFKIRGSLREMPSLGLVIEQDGAYVSSDKGKAMLNP